MANRLNEFGLTEKQEKFCQVFVETGNASRAYRESYDVKTTNQNTIAVKASNMLDETKINLRIASLKEKHSKRHNVTVDSLIAELEEARIAALTAETVQASAATGATMGKAKLLGLDKQLIELSGEIGVRKTLDDFYGE